MSKELTIRELESWIPLLEMFSDKHSVLQGAAGEDAMNVGDVLEIIRSHITCRAVTDLCCRNQAARPEALRIPEGWKLVPVEPTDAMLTAARLLDSFPDGDDRVLFLNGCASDNYRAMIAAAPSIPSPPRRTDEDASK